MLTLHRDNTFGSSATQKKVFVHGILADVLTRSTFRIAAKTKEYEFKLCGCHDVIRIPPAQVRDARQTRPLL